MKNYSLYVCYNNEAILVCEDELSVNAECFADALLMMHQNVMRCAYHANLDAEEQKEYLMYADLLIAIYCETIPYPHETDAERNNHMDTCYVIDATEYIDKYYSI